MRWRSSSTWRSSARPSAWSRRRAPPTTPRPCAPSSRSGRRGSPAGDTGGAPGRQNRPMTHASSPGALRTTDIPARLDALAWSRFHTRVVVALGITWILDGLEVTLAGAVSGALQASPALRLTDAEVGLAASAYLAGAVLGAVFFGWLTDRLGRKRLFWITLGVYLSATGATALSPDIGFFMVCRFLTGAGIGGEYAAINSAIQELVPA